MKNNQTINQDLRSYIERDIIPRYDSFDQAHRRDHVMMVIEESIHLAQYYDVNINMVYAIAAFHDTGLVKDRASHHLVSGWIIRTDEMLQSLFSAQEIELMAEAAEDHRASAKHAPRSIYGKIVAEADRIIDPAIIVTRTIQYGLSHYPDYSKEKHFERFCEHMDEKYAEKGYLKLWIPESTNAKRLQEFRKILMDKAMLVALFDKEWNFLSTS